MTRSTTELSGSCKLAPSCHYNLVAGSKNRSTGLRRSSCSLANGQHLHRGECRSALTTRRSLDGSRLRGQNRTLLRVTPHGLISATLSRSIRTQRLFKYFTSRQTQPLKQSKQDVFLFLCSQRCVVRVNCRQLDYELVKIYHPDVVSLSLAPGSPPSGEQGVLPSAMPPEGHLTPEIAQARFQAVTRAYDSLQKGKAKGKAHLGGNPFVDATESKMSARRRRELRARAELRVGHDEKWRERLIVGALFAVSGILMFLHVWSGMLNSFVDYGGFRVSNVRDTERRVSYCRCCTFTGERKEGTTQTYSRSISPTERPDRQHQDQTDSRGREATGRSITHPTLDLVYKMVFPRRPQQATA